MREAAHTTYDDALVVLKILITAGHAAMFAGGCVRDRLLGVAPKDYDIATSARPEQVTVLFQSRQMRVIPTGIEHGTVTIMTHSGPVEITTLRRDVKTDGRHAIVDFEGATFDTDAARRDFTINAMFEDESGQVHDFYGGLQDIKNRILRFVGQPEARIREDYLRILRYFRFWARLGFAPDQEALTAISCEAHGLKYLSAERVTSELWSIFSAPHKVDALIAMAKSDILGKLIPDASPIDQRALLMLRDAELLPKNTIPWVTLTLLMGLGRSANWTESRLLAFARQWRLSDKDSQTLSVIFSGWEALPSLERSTADALDFNEMIEKKSRGPSITELFGPLWSFFARHFYDDLRLEITGWLMAIDKAFGHRRLATLPLSGHDVMEAFPSLEGKSVGDILSHLRRAYRNGAWHNRIDGLALMRSFVDQKTSG
jgi:tRNA nucleotidyltransferase/poly(A) polymerase